MRICIAGKNNMAIAAVKTVLKARLVTRDELWAMCNASDDGIGTFQDSFREFCMSNDIRIVKPADLFAATDLILVSCQYDNLLPVKSFASPHLFNIHTSLLPKYRGAHTCVLPILNGDKFAGATLHVMDHGIDTGPIVDRVRFPIAATATARDLYATVVSAGIRLFRRNIRNLINATYTTQSQIPANASYHSRNAIKYSEVTINLQKTAIEIIRQVRAFTFLEYQVPTALGFRVMAAEMLARRSTRRSGALLEEGASYIDVASIDYDVRLRKFVE